MIKIHAGRGYKNLWEISEIPWESDHVIFRLNPPMNVPKQANQRGTASVIVNLVLLPLWLLGVWLPVARGDISQSAQSETGDHSIAVNQEHDQGADTNGAFSFNDN